MSTTVRSHAKINLGLAIGAPRADGFHALSTVYQTLAMHDRVTVTARRAERTALQMSSNDERVPCDERNTAWKMVALALEELGLGAEVAIHIEKTLPVQGGLGAGSANAVAALVGLEVELGLNGPAKAPQNWGARRLEIAARVGSDVPLFLIGGAVLGMDRGQQVIPLPDFESVWTVIATPAVGVSTAQAFRDWDALCVDEGLTQEKSSHKLDELNRAYASAFAEAIPQGKSGVGSSGVFSLGEDRAGTQGSALVRTGITSWITNDFERVVFRQHPPLAEIKQTLATAARPEESLYAALSGSGSALFGLYAARGAAEAVCARLRADGVAASLTRTLPRSEYWSQMLCEHV